MTTIETSRWTLLVAMIVLAITNVPCSQAYKVNLPKASRPYFHTTSLSEHKKELSHEETYALRRPPKKRSSASKVRMTSAVIDHHSTSTETTNTPTFERRMRSMVLGEEKKKKIQPPSSNMPRNVQMCTSLEEYKQKVGEEREKIVVARFYAPWCKACKAIQPMYYRLASMFTNVKFIEVPVTEENAALHQGLGVPSLPYSHIYEPNTGLVEELKISRQHISDFGKKLQSYVTGRCELKDLSTTSPYALSDEE